MGSFLLAGGTKGKRIALPNSRIMIHQPSGGARGMASDIEIQAKEILDLRKRLNKIYTDNTGQKLSVIEKAMDRDNFMSPEQALDFGLIDKIIEKR
jgi:ATP-dependent Clp protease protease subunit